MSFPLTHFMPLISFDSLRFQGVSKEINGMELVNLILWATTYLSFRVDAKIISTILGEVRFYQFWENIASSIKTFIIFIKYLDVLYSFSCPFICNSIYSLLSYTELFCLKISNKKYHFCLSQKRRSLQAIKFKTFSEKMQYFEANFF